MTRAVRKVDNWKVWMVIAYVGLAGVLVWTFTLNQSTSRTQARQARDEAIRQAELESSTESQRSQCLGSIPTLVRINRFVGGVYRLHAVLERNARAVLEATPKDDPTYEVRRENWLRVKATVADVSGVHFPVPTRAKCAAIGKPG